jgi:hypothetical protein
VILSRVPFLDRAEVADGKLIGYLLSREHPFGRAKARFFVEAGFRPAAPGELREALLRHASEHPVVAREETPFGSKYVVDGPFYTPAGGVVELRTVWFVESGEEVARFVTAYPRPRRRTG